jgi:gluconokinase
MPVVVIMGVSGSGKSVVGAQLAKVLKVPFCDGDDLHSAANILKMEMGQPLDDVDRAPWLARVAQWISDHAGGGVVTCSALRRSYRDRLREGQPISPSMVLLNAERAVLEGRLEGRSGHFMPASLLDSQLGTLELPSSDENVLVLSASEQPEHLARDITDWLSSKAKGNTL